MKTMCSALWLGRIVLPGASGRDLGRPKDDHWVSGVGDTKDLKPAMLQLRERFLQPTKAARSAVQAASEVIGTEAQLLLLPQLPVLGWVFKRKVPSTHHATDAMWRNYITLIT